MEDKSEKEEGERVKKSAQRSAMWCTSTRGKLRAAAAADAKCTKDGREEREPERAKDNGRETDWEQRRRSRKKKNE